MVSIPPLNGAARRRTLTPLLFVLGILLSVGLLHGRLATLYARPAAVPAEPSRLPVGFPDPELIVPADDGFRPLVPSQGLLLIQGPRRLLGQQEVSLCDQRAATTTATLLPLYVGWDWARVREAAIANLSAQPPRPPHYGLKNPLLDDGPEGVDVPTFAVTMEPASAPLRPYADEAPLRATVRDRRPVWLLADTAASGSGPTLAFRRDLWLLWNAGEPADAEHWDHAVRVRRLVERDCPFGRLRVSVYGAAMGVEAGFETEPRIVLWYSGDGRAAWESRLAPGRYAAPTVPPPRREDGELFERALAAGLLRLDADGRIAVAPADLPLRRLYAGVHPDLLAPRDGEPDWLSGTWNESVRALYRTLHFGAAGRYVRQQVDIFNGRQWLAAVRWRPESTAMGDWRAEWGGAPLALTAAMPPLVGRLFTEIPRGWEPWRRVARWPVLAGRPPIRFRLTLDRPARRGARLEVLAVGAVPTITGAAVVAREPRCLATRSCGERDAAAHWLRLELGEGATGLTLDLQPLSATVFPDAYRYDFAHIQRVGDRLVWRDPPATVGAAPRRPVPAEVRLRDRAGAVLLEHGQPTEAAWVLGLAALVGLDPAHESAVGPALARLGDHGVAVVDARLTVAPRMQAAARRALLGRLSGVGAAFGATDPHREARVASLIVLDADRGDILAAVSSPEPSQGVAWTDLYSFALGHPRRDPLRIQAWQHDGGGLYPAGSAFKLVDALLLEREATRRPELAALLAGPSGPEWMQPPLALAYDFAADAACYPAHAAGCAPWARRPGERYDRPARPAVHNFRGAAGAQTLLERMRRQGDDRYGLAQALRDSLNTWFAWLVETTDATLLDDPTAPGLAGVRALTPNALRKARPLLDMVAGLGFGAAQDLDGGLLPAGVIESGDVLRTTASALDPMTNRTEVRLAALGFRMQVTPLQLAEVAAAIATGRQTAPRLLAELNGRSASEPEGAALGITTDRIRQGMQLVVSAGTARAAFADPRFDAIRPHLYAKTGTADLDETGAAQNAWLVGWLEPSALPGESRRLAFACLISHTAGTGGEECGPVVADWLAALATAKDKP
ncbi:MAG: penicillin-binding transpeptidase domain-containing protein [Candidatus Contendobacter sp.]|nr:penicillin-binding transpeptidase domain-containing protein [Candidatus Contendobacter sp.]MDS4056966.1 penicillin-binding transpeptidase domain-containing protein [Candidatus Contendobacter sp.]